MFSNVASYEKARDAAAALREVPALHASLAVASSAPRSQSRPSATRMDDRIQREMLGEGVALDEAVVARKNAGWAVKQRHLQKSDVGHRCCACRQPLRDLNEEVTVWTGAAIYRRFHPACAASYMLRADRAGAGSATGSRDVPPVEDIVEGYADGWRAPRGDGVINAGRPRRAVEAARQWLLSQDPSAWPSLRGDVFATVTINENGVKKAVPGLTHAQLHILQTRHCWSCDDMDKSHADGEQPDSQFECAICFGSPDPSEAPCVQLPCAPQHIFHVACVLPWLRKASLCPTCRKDLRPFLSTRTKSIEP